MKRMTDRMTEPVPRKRRVVLRKTMDAAGGPAGRAGRSAPAPRRAGGGGMSGPLVAGLVIVALVLMTVIGFAWAARRRAPGGYRLPVATVRMGVPTATDAPKRYDELGGKTMAEWMTENNGDNALLKERQQRLRAFRGR